MHDARRTPDCSRLCSTPLSHARCRRPPSHTRAHRRDALAAHTDKRPPAAHLRFDAVCFAASDTKSASTPWSSPPPTSRAAAGASMPWALPLTTARAGTLRWRRLRRRRPTHDAVLCSTPPLTAAALQSTAPYSARSHWHAFDRHRHTPPPTRARRQHWHALRGRTIHAADAPRRRALAAAHASLQQLNLNYNNITGEVGTSFSKIRGIDELGRLPCCMYVLNWQFAGISFLETKVCYCDLKLVSWLR
jgi:hypothetical protein